MSATLSVDAEQLGYIHTTTAWHFSDSYNLPAGSHRVRWDPQIRGMDPTDKGQSYFWLDQVKFGTAQTLTLQASSGGLSWSDLGPGQTLGVAFVWEPFRLIVPLADASKRMFRLKVMLNP